MLAANLKITTSDGDIKKIMMLAKHDEIPCVDIITYNKIDYKIREPRAAIDKIYNFYFPGGVLSCTTSQKVLCQGRKIVTVGEALISRLRIHTGSGLCLPHFIENSSPRATVFNVTPCGHMNRAAVISSVFCL